MPFDSNQTLRRLASAMLILGVVVGCRPDVGSPNAEATSETSAVSIQLNWYPEVEHGGVYQALTDGTYSQAGMAVEIRPGGRATPIAPELVLGRSQFAITNADDVVLFRAQGADIVAVLAAIQQHPRCILVQADSGVESFEDLRGMTLQRQAGRPFLTYLQKRGYLDGVLEAPYHNSIAAMMTDSKIAVQAYCVAEPLLAKQQGLEVRTLMVSDLGWNPYSSVLVTTGEMIRTQPDRVAEFVRATRAGWQTYFTDPTSANAAILAANQHGMTAEVLQFGAEQMVPLAGADTDIGAVGKMSADRWQRLVDQMMDLELIPPDTVTANECFTTEFLD